MNRRNFLRAMVGGVAVAAAERTFPFRVFFFPKEVVNTSFIWLQLEAFANQLPELFDRDSMLLHRMSGLRYFHDGTILGPYLGISRSPVVIAEPVSYTKLYPEALDAIPNVD